MQMALELGDEVARSHTRVRDVIHVAHEPDFVPDLDSYDEVIAFFSGGKDSIAMVLRLIEMGRRPVLYHHLVDGGPDDSPELRFDWPCTDDYTRKVAEALGLEIYFSWREGGLSGEMLKKDARTRASVFESPEGIGRAGGVSGAISTRMRYPQVSPDLRVRWCSGVAKVDVGAAQIAGQERFRGKRLLVLTGERAQESAARARYSVFEPHRTHQPGPRARRHVDQWRPVLHWREEQVWDIMRRHGVVPHPAYYLGWSRCSCMICIFNGKDETATVRELDPSRFRKMASLESDFGCTIKRNSNIVDFADAGSAFAMDPAVVRLAMSTTYDAPVLTNDWIMPAGAFRGGGGPT